LAAAGAGVAAVPVPRSVRRWYVPSGEWPDHRIYGLSRSPGTAAADLRVGFGRGTVQSDLARLLQAECRGAWFHVALAASSSRFQPALLIPRIPSKKL